MASALRPKGEGGSRDDGVPPTASRSRAAGLDATIIKNALSLYGLQFVGYLISFASVPYLARVLRPEGWGLVAFAQASTVWPALIVDFGFGISGAREIATFRHEEGRISQVISSITAARLSLLLPSALVAAVIGFLVKSLRTHPLYLVFAWLAAAAGALDPQWYFQGIERLPVPAALDLVTRCLNLLALFILVKSPDDALLVLIIQALCSILIASAHWILLFYSEDSLYLPHLTEIVEAMKGGLSLFLFRFTVTLYTSANAFILGFFVASASLACFVGAEKVIKAALSVLTPVAGAIFPRMSYLLGSELTGAMRLFKTTMWIMIAAGCFSCLVILTFASRIVSIVLGPGYGETVALLRLMCLSVPLIAISNVLGIQWMLPSRMDKAFTAIISIAGVMNLILAVLLVPRSGAWGMAVSTVAAELFTASTMAVTVWFHWPENSEHAVSLRDSAQGQPMKKAARI